jgi:uncharacterized protein YndB with AHSA1/START domain
MELKTQIIAEEGKQALVITRTFDLPVELLFKAYTEPEIVAQWMGTKVLKLENKNHGGFQFETTDPKGNKYRFNGTIHTFSPNQKIVRTFEFENMPFGVQLELLEFLKLTETTSKLLMHVLYETPEQRDQNLKMGMTQGINMAHNRLQEVVNNLN